jgi:hypothetical protein
MLLSLVSPSSVSTTFPLQWDTTYCAGTPVGRIRISQFNIKCSHLLGQVGGEIEGPRFAT